MFNTEELYQQVGSELLRRRGHEFSPELLDAMMGRPGNVSLDIMIRWHQLTDTVEQLAAESDEIFVDILNSQLAPMPGLLDLLAALEQAQIPRSVCTSSGRRFVTDVLGRFDLEPKFSFLLTAEDVRNGKPDPEIYLRAASNFGCPPEQMLVLEDSQTGCRAAHAAGAFVVAVPGSHSRHHDFSPARFIAQGLTDPLIHQALGLPRSAV
jgi:HAD superfamily hydrolase (TIGR01509 family)